jgi:hypothetical protein
MVLVVNIDDAATTPISLNGYADPWWDVSGRALNLLEDILRTYKCTLSANSEIKCFRTHVVWTCFFYFSVWNSCPKMIRTFNYIMCMNFNIERRSMYTAVVSFRLEGMRTLVHKKHTSSQLLFPCILLSRNILYSCCKAYCVLYLVLCKIFSYGYPFWDNLYFILASYNLEICVWPIRKEIAV